VRELGLTFPGDNAARFAAASEIIHALAGACVPALTASFIMGELQQRPEDYTPAYLVHEFMPAAWRPLYVTEVRAAMATIGLTPVGSATLSENLDWMVLSEAARKTLATVSGPDVRELVRDFYLDQRFRRDVFSRDNQRMPAKDRTANLFSSTFALARPVPAIHYTTATPAGALVYDTPEAQAIIAALTRGGQALAGPGSSPAPAQDLRTLLTLCATGDIMPAEPGNAAVGDLNRILCGRIDGPEEIRWLALPCGTALEIDRGLMRLLRDGSEIDESQFPGWRDFLGFHGILDR
jgi:hypothetical protein